MKKDFDGWNFKKQKLHNTDWVPLYHEREIWWCALGVNVGFEQDGTGGEYRRPVLVLKGLSKETCLIIPLTTATHDHVLRPQIGIVDGKMAKALLSQIRVIDNKRFVRKIGYLDKNIFNSIRKTIKDWL